MGPRRSFRPWLGSAAVLAASIAARAAVAGGEVEVLHWWTSGSEAKALQSLKATLRAQGDVWKDFAVAGGGGDSAMTLLKSRVASGNAPAAAQIKGPALQDWAGEGALAPIDDVARAGHWDAVLPRAIADQMKYRGSYVAVPVNVHRVNWLWINPAAFRRAGARVPTNWDEFFAAADALRRVGIVPVAHGGQGWQDLTLFESVALGVGGPAFYRDALVRLDPAALAGPTMAQVLRTFKRIKPYTDRDAPGRDWNLATAMVIDGQAAMQFMGDWAKGEYLAVGAQPGRDVVCTPVPGTAGSFIYSVDSFALFKLRNAADARAQKDLAAAIMAPEFQQVFSLDKGSIPVRMDVGMERFDACAKASNADFRAAARSNALLPSLAHGMAVAPAAEAAFKDVVSAYWNSERMTPQDAMQRLADAARRAPARPSL
ncbi:MAG: carbohydrate ABC transporter substrate-binding protein [Pelomonas sp.]|nr:carbohydrate ABC transporter substrate-binding protein [Roseateles sp.]